MLVHISGKTKAGIEFTAGMTLKKAGKDQYAIMQIAPILRSSFFTGSHITIEQIQSKCKREKWLCEIEIEHGEIAEIIINKDRKKAQTPEDPTT